MEKRKLYRGPKSSLLVPIRRPLRGQMGFVCGRSLGDNRSKLKLEKFRIGKRKKLFFNHEDSQSVKQVVQRGLQFS